MNFKKIAAILSLLCLSVSTLNAQQTLPYWDEVQAFKKQDSIKFPSPGQILFIGSSTFTKWKDVQEYFPAYPIINRGFGGSVLTDLIRCRYDILYAYQPKQILIYCGENDMANNDTVSAKTVLSRFDELFQLIRSKYPNTPVAFISIKPSPSRAKLWPKFVEANRLIRYYLAAKKNTSFIDVYQQMLNADGTARLDLYIEDCLHMNAKGYAIWKKIIQPYLLK